MEVEQGAVAGQLIGGGGDGLANDGEERRDEGRAGAAGAAVGGAVIVIVTGGGTSHPGGGAGTCFLRDHFLPVVVRQTGGEGKGGAVEGHLHQTGQSEDRAGNGARELGVAGEIQPL